jgi:tRNA(Ile)-lysidine synthase
MIRYIGKIPREVTIACSGGIDSMVITDFLLKGKRKVNLAYFNHDTMHSKDAEKFVKEYANSKNLKLVIGRVKGIKGRRSLEEFWRDERYDFFNSIGSKFIITCHHLGDAVETWLWSACHGNPKLIPYQRSENLFRPFLLTSKASIKNYATSKNVKWIEDPSNMSTNFTRNSIRHNMMPHVLKVNPGIKKTIYKKMLALYKDV